MADDKKSPKDSKLTKVLKFIGGETTEAAATGGFMLLIHKLWTFITSNPDIQKKAGELVINIMAGGKGRGDDLVCYSSLIDVNGISAGDKILFMTKHQEMLNPDLEGKTVKEKSALILGRTRARGIVSLIAEDKTFSEKGNGRFFFASKVWHGIFLEIDQLPDEHAKLEMLEKRIIHFGENITTGGVAESIKMDLSEGAVTATTALESATNWLNSKFR